MRCCRRSASTVSDQLMTASVAGVRAAAEGSTVDRKSGKLRWMAAGLLAGLAIAALLWGARGPEWTSSGSLLMSGIPGTAGSGLIELSGEVDQIIATGALITESDAVSDAADGALGSPRGTLRGRITADVRSGAMVIDVTVHGAQRGGLVKATNAVLRAAQQELQRLQASAEGEQANRVGVLSTAGRPVDQRAQFLGFYLTLGAVIGGSLGAFAAVLLNLRRKWPRVTISLPRYTRWDMDAEIRAALAHWRHAFSRRDIRLAVAGTVIMVLAHAVTGSKLPLVVLALVAAGGALRDLRWPAVGMLVLGAGAPSGRIDLIKVGPLTLSILDFVVLSGIGALIFQRMRLRLPAHSGAARIQSFVPAMVAFLAAVLSGLLVGFAAGATQTEYAEPVRVLVLLPAAFFLFRSAFTGRTAQLVLALLANAAFASVLAVLAVPLGWPALLADERDSVITGTTSADVLRLFNPVLPTWSVLLVILAGGVAAGSHRWVWWLVAIPGIVHVALSFNRSTWVPLILTVILAAGLRGGMRGIARRAAVTVVVGSLGVALALSGTFGSAASDLGARALSAVTGSATSEDSLSLRLQENADAVSTLKNSPLLGVGMGEPMGGTVAEYDSVQNAIVVKDRPFIHNQYLRLWLLMGVPGLVAFAWILVRLGGMVREFVSFGTRKTAVPIAVALGIGCTGAQGVFQTNLIDGATMIIMGVSLALIEICLRQCSGRAASATKERHNGTLKERPDRRARGLA